MEEVPSLPQCGVQAVSETDYFSIHLYRVQASPVRQAQGNQGVFGKVLCHLSGEIEV
jgi:hypothetical protein